MFSEVSGSVNNTCLYTTYYGACVCIHMHTHVHVLIMHVTLLESDIEEGLCLHIWS